MGDIDAFLAGYKLPGEEVAVCRDPGLVDRFTVADSRVNAAEANAGLAGAPADLIEARDALAAEIEDSVQVFRLQATPLPDWLALQGEHPPTEEERAAGEFAHPDTWEPAAVAACAVDPTMTVEQAARMRGLVAAAEWAQLRDAVIRLHTGGAGPKSRLLSALRRASVVSSDTPPSTGSLAEPSSDGSGEQ